MKILKKIGSFFRRLFLWFIMVAAMVVILVGGVTLFFYQRAGEHDLPSSQVLFSDTALEVNGYRFTIPILGGITQKELSKPEDLTVQDLGTFDTQPVLTLSADATQNCTANLSVTDSQGQTVFSGSLEDFSSFSFAFNGVYQAQLRVNWASKNGKPYGEYFYRFRFTLDLKSEIAISSETVSQGDVVAVSVSGLPQGASVQVESELGIAHPVSRFGKTMLYLPVAYNREDREYPIRVTAGGYTKEFIVDVLYNPFKKVTLETDTLAGSETAVQQYQQTVRPLYETFSEEIFWSGVFQSPIEQPNDGVVLSDYGDFEYIGNRTSPSRNTGVTYKCHPEKPVSAPAAGTVVFAGNLELTKGLVVIEHGAGLKSYLYHLSSLNVKTGDTLQAGDLVGTGSELLQFDLRLTNQAINPNLAMSGKGGLFFR